MCFWGNLLGIKMYPWVLNFQVKHRFVSQRSSSTWFIKVNFGFTARGLNETRNIGNVSKFVVRLLDGAYRLKTPWYQDSQVYV